MFLRSNGLVKLGGYSWLSKSSDACNYDFPARARKDRMFSILFSVAFVGYFPQEVFEDNLWTPGVDIYALGMTIIHFVTQKAPYNTDYIYSRYEEKGSADNIINAIHNGELPEGKRVIRETDDLLYDFVEKCLLPHVIH